MHQYQGAHPAHKGIALLSYVRVTYASTQLLACGYIFQLLSCNVAKLHNAC